MRPLDFMPLGTRGTADERHDIWLWWPVRVKWAPRGIRGRSRWLRGFTQHGWERESRVEPLEIVGHTIMRVRTVRVVVRCWNVGPLCITFGEPPAAAKGGAA